MPEIRTTTTFDAWLASLGNTMAQARVNARISNMAEGNFGDCKPVGKGVSESRIDFGPGYRLYFKRVGEEVFLLLAGGDKSTQQKDIKTAQALAADL